MRKRSLIILTGIIVMPLIGGFLIVVFGVVYNVGTRDLRSISPTLYFTQNLRKI